MGTVTMQILQSVRLVKNVVQYFEGGHLSFELLSVHGTSVHVKKRDICSRFSVVPFLLERMLGSALLN
jgi:hypothetical protein